LILFGAYGLGFIQGATDVVITQASIGLIVLGSIVAVGALLVIVGFTGCFGALCKQSSLLKTYAIIQLIFILCFVGALVLVILPYDKVIKTWVDDVQIEYGTNAYVDTTKRWNTLMQTGQCCGVYNYSDWKTSYYSASTNFSVPQACCKFNVTETGSIDYVDLVQCRQRAEADYTDGDEDATNEFLNIKGCEYIVNTAEVASIVFCSLMITFLFVSTLLSCCIMKKKVQKVDAS